MIGSRAAGDIRQQIVLSGVGGQGILFLSRILADAAIAKGLPVLASETHGMAQRGGVVTSHLKVGGFFSPLVRAGHADGLLVLKEENLPLHGPFLSPGGWVVVNAPAAPKEDGGIRVHALDADALALAAKTPQAVNLILLGFALAHLGGRGPEEGLFCTADDVRDALRRRHASAGTLVSASLSALELGIARGT